MGPCPPREKGPPQERASRRTGRDRSLSGRHFVQWGNSLSRLRKASHGRASVAALARQAAGPCYGSEMDLHVLVSHFPSALTPTVDRKIRRDFRALLKMRRDVEFPPCYFPASSRAKTTRRGVRTGPASRDFTILVIRSLRSVKRQVSPRLVKSRRDAATATTRGDQAMATTCGDVILTKSTTTWAGHSGDYERALLQTSPRLAGARSQSAAATSANRTSAMPKSPA
jgi:hypothetical protein